MISPNKFVLPVCLFVLIIIVGQNSRAETDKAGAGIGEFPQKFHVDGNKIVDESGNETIFRGVNPEDPVWQGSGLDPDIGIWSQENFRVMSEWGATVVRLPIHPATWRKLGVDESFGFIDQAIEWAGKFKMYVIIDFHSIGFVSELDFFSTVDFVFRELYKTTREEMFEFWDLVSKRYAGNDVVAFYELFNEPALNSAGDHPADFTIDDWMVWKQFNEDLIDSIRVNDSDKTVIVGGFQFAYDLTFVSDTPIKRPNLVYSAHPYPDANWKIDWDTAFGNVKANFPVFATEFGFDSDEFFEEVFNDNGGKGLYRDEIVSFLEEKKISWTVWSFSHSFTPTLLLDLDFTPSESGEFFRKKMLEHVKITETPLPTVTQVPTPKSFSRPTPKPKLTPEETPASEKSFTFDCNRSIQQGSNDIVRLVLELGEDEGCVLRLTNIETGKPVKISTNLKAGSKTSIMVSPKSGVADNNGELEFTITAVKRGIDWIAWAVPNENDEFEFSKQTYDNGLAWGMFVQVK